MTLGEKLVKIRENLDFNQEKFAEKLGIHAKTLREYEKNKRQPQTETLKTLISEYNVNPYYLFLNDEDMFASPPQEPSEKLLREAFSLSPEEAGIVMRFIKLVKKEDYKDFAASLKSLL
jgi:transcriptional regulator with XRE-family HTH domain